MPFVGGDRLRELVPVAAAVDALEGVLRGAGGFPAVPLPDTPPRSAVRIGTPALLRLAAHPRIVAVKDATGDLFAGSEVMAQTDLAYYCGDDDASKALVAEMLRALTLEERRLAGLAALALGLALLWLARLTGGLP